MANRTLTFELPDDFIEHLGAPEEVARQAKESFVLDLLRQARIGQSRAAELLGITRWSLLDLMVERQIASGPLTPEEVDAEFDTIHRFFSPEHVR